MASKRGSDGTGSLSCGLTLEDEFVLTRIRTKAHSLQNKDRDNYLWDKVFKLICRERAFKTVMAEVGIAVDTNMQLFDEEELKED
jgi:hypothetical protein